MGSRMTAQVTQKTPNATRCAARGEERALLSGVLIERPHGQAIPGPIVVRDGPRVCAKFHSLSEFSHSGTRPLADTDRPVLDPLLPLASGSFRVGHL